MKVINKIKKYKVLIWLIGILITSKTTFAMVQNNNNILISFGEYSTKQHYYPLLLESFDGGNTWEASNVIKNNLPKNYNSNGVLNNISCENNICILVGQYRDKKDVTQPLLYRSNDNGVTWTFIESLPNDFKGNGQFTSVSCSSHLCIAVGEYQNFNNEFVPLLTKSNDNGLTWSYPRSIISNLPANSYNGAFNSIHCKNGLCIAAGKYQIGINGVEPLLAKSNNKGETWDYVTVLPSDYWGMGKLYGANISA